MFQVIYSFTSYSIGTFSDTNLDVLTYQAQQNSGSGLPSWLSFESNTRTFSGTPDVAAAYSIKVTATDETESSVSTTFSLTITNVDPVVGTAIPNQVAQVN